MTIRILSMAMLISSIFHSGNAKASGNKDKSIITRIVSPDYINLQYAGNLGLGSVGVGYISENEKHNFGFSYGYLPSSVNSVEVHSVSAKGAFNFQQHRVSENISMNIYTGTNLLYSMTNNTYLKFPGHFPTDYYFTNAIHVAPFLGMKIGAKRTLTKFSYLELGTLDYYLFHCLKDKYLKFIDCLNLCVGVSIPLR